MDGRGHLLNRRLQAAHTTFANQWLRNIATTAPIMTARRLVENCVLTNQTAVVDEMLNKHLLPEEYIYPFVGDVMEWWLIDSWLAERLKREGEVIIDEYGCCWWGRLSERTVYLHGQRDTENCRRVKTRPAYRHSKTVNYRD